MLTRKVGRRSGWPAVRHRGCVAVMPEGGIHHRQFLGRAAGVRLFSSGVPDFQRGISMKKKIDITAVPELRTSVGMHGSLKQKEVGGPICLTIAVAILYAF